MRVEWLKLALDDFDETVEYIAERNPAAARRIAATIWREAKALGNHPELGRIGRVPGTRELSIRNTEYLIAYRIRGEVVQILRLLHAARRWPQRF
ncbi:type II toxin-antitoxin system RelE/ParE family toxin [Endothiovibrio diazotrophicus]